MRKILLVVILSVLFVSVGYAQTNLRVNLFQMKYIGFDSYNNGYRLSVNLSLNQPGHLIYLEEYYVVENRYPRFVNSYKYNFGDLVQENSNYTASFEILRPTDAYTLIKGIILLDNKRVAEGWLTKNVDFIDNTGWGDDNSNTMVDNVDKYEIRENNINFKGPVTYKFTTPGPIYEINVTGKSNTDTTLRLELLKGVPSNAYEPTGNVYRYINIVADNNEINQIKPKYKIEKSWIDDNKIKSLGMLGWDKDNKTWLPLPTKKIDQDDKYMYFESTSPNLSTYAIIGFIGQSTKQNSSIRTAPIQPKVTPSEKLAEDTNETKQQTKEPLFKNIPGFESVLAIVVLLLIRRRK